MKRILMLIIVIIFLANGVNAIVCCEKLKTGNNYCVNKESVNQCYTSNDFKAYQGIACEKPEVPNCKIGCCSYKNDGSCVNAQERVKCEKNGGYWSADNCEDVDFCKKGCCFLNTNTFYSSDGECGIKAEELGISPVFETGYNDDTECQIALNEILGVKTMGCCVSPDGNCQYTAREDCDKDFRKDKSCFDIGICKCDVGYKCVNDKKDVYKVSSCGDEKVQESCDGINNYCGLVRSNEKDVSSVYLANTYYKWGINLGKNNIPGSSGSVEGVDCVDIKCIKGNKFINDEKNSLFSGVNQIITITNEMLGGKSSRRNGESWCISPNIPDQPGTRHYVYSCDKGKIVSKACNVNRYKGGEEEGGVCKESSDKGFSEADCIDTSWSKGKAVDNPGGINNPPAVQFYTGFDIKGVSFSNSCGYCNTKYKWYNKVIGDMCKSDKCNALGDCSFDDAGFSLGGCAKGAALAEALWLSAGSIAPGGIGGGLTANTGWGGFLATGPIPGLGGKAAAATKTTTVVKTGGTVAKTKTALETTALVTTVYTNLNGDKGSSGGGYGSEGLSYLGPSTATETQGAQEGLYVTAERPTNLPTGGGVDVGETRTNSKDGSIWEFRGDDWYCSNCDSQGRVKK